ncbi:MAG: DUF763 domain-containing protein [Candidatus Hydrothermales bacterium]
MEVINLPLHYGKVPEWLFDKIKKLSSIIIEYLLEELDTSHILEKFSDPLWFQSFGCFLGFDWHSSGITVTVTNALKKGLSERNIPIFIAGGKGKFALETPKEILNFSEKLNIDPNNFIYLSRLTAKIDNACVQDKHSLYHHTFWFDKKGNWLVVQQGMNVHKKTARRYHIFSKKLKEITCEPHSGIIANCRETKVLDLVSEKNKVIRENIVNLIKERQIKEIYKMPERHLIKLRDINVRKVFEISLEFYRENINKFEDILLIKGVGEKTLRALTLLSELIYGKRPDYSDPARFSFAHGGKDGTPYRINRSTYDKTIEILEKILTSKKGFTNSERSYLLKRIYCFVNEGTN